MAGDALAVGHGEGDTANQFPWVVRVFPADFSNSCSGILISPGLVLTSRHCIVGDLMKCLPWSHDEPVNKWAYDYYIDTIDGLGNAEQVSHTWEVTKGASPVHYYIDVSDTGPVDACSKNDSSTDLAIIRLDRRIPISRIQPMHVPLNGYYRKCKDEYDGSPFDGLLIGFGYDVPPADIAAEGIDHGQRNYRQSSRWERETEHPTLLPLVNEDLDGAVYANYWLVGAQYPEFYHGCLKGDSGGPLVSNAMFDDMRQRPGFVGNPEGRILCGVTSRYYPATPLDTSIATLEGPAYYIGSDHAAVDGANLAWIQSKVIAPDGNFIGECFLGDIPALQDQDSDDDLIPDACDPCPHYYDANYDQSKTPDYDGDGVPDRCDNCPTVPNPLMHYQKADLSWVLEQADNDHDGYGAECDTCAFTDKIVATPGTVIVDKSEYVTDYQCCNTDADCAVASCKVVHHGEGVDEPPTKLCFPGDSRGTIISDIEDSMGVVVPLCANHCAAPVDFDCDNTGDLCDNCPGTSNPGQVDTDKDGAGDACDNCPGSKAEPGQPQDLNPPCEYWNGGDVFCNSLSPGSVCLPPHSEKPSPGNVSRCSVGEDQDGDGLGDLCDSCAEVPNVTQANCNLDMEKASLMAYPYAGDACDPNPCSDMTVFSYPTSISPSPGAIQKLLYSPNLLPWNRKTSPEYPYTFQALPASPVPDFPSPTPKATVGMRFCKCEYAAHPTASACRTQGCPLQSSQYLASGSNWRTVSLDQYVSTHSGVPFQPGAQYAGLGVINPVPNDAKVYGYASWGPTFSSFWYVGQDASVFGTGEDYLMGVLWSHVWEVENIVNPAFSANRFRPWSNHYVGGTFGTPPDAHVSPPAIDVGLKIPVPNWLGLGGEPSFPDPDPNPEPGWDVGSVAEWVRRSPDVPLLVADTAGLAVQLRNGNAAVDMTPMMTARAMTALSDPTARWLPEAEPPGWSAASTVQLVSLSESGTTVKSAIGVSGAAITDLLHRTEIEPGDGEVPVPTNSAMVSSAPSASPAVGRTQFGAVLSSSANVVFVVGGISDDDHQQPKNILRYSLRDGTWMELDVKGPGKPGVVLAATYRPQDQSLYVIDELRFGPVRFARLIRIDTRDFTSAVLGLWLRRPLRDRTFITNTEDGHLLIVGAGRKTYAAVAVEPRVNNTLKIVSAILGTGRVAAEPHLTRHGLTVPVEDPAVGIRNIFVSADELDKRVTFLPTECF